MSALASAYDNIRVLRKQVQSAQDRLGHIDAGPGREAALLRVAALTADLMRALHDFAELGYEDEVVSILSVMEVRPPLRALH